MVGDGYEYYYYDYDYDYYYSSKMSTCLWILGDADDRDEGDWDE